MSAAQADILIRTEGCAGRITLTRASALNALSHAMILAIEEALDRWATDDTIRLVIVDAEGDKAFCAGGDIQQLYETGRAGDNSYGRRFWRDEYHLNARIARYPKPYVAFMQGFTMGGGVGIACHGSHRIVCESSRIAMPEVGIGLVPDVGGSALLARAPGRLGEYLGLTGARMGPGDAIFAGFADFYLPQAAWPALIRALQETGDISLIRAQAAPAAPLAPMMPRITALFEAPSLRGIMAALTADGSDFAAKARKAIARNSPLAMACTIALIHRLKREAGDMGAALELEYRFSHRAMSEGDFLEGVRAAVIDKDRAPRWKHGLETPLKEAAARMLAPLGPESLKLESERNVK